MSESTIAALNTKIAAANRCIRAMKGGGVYALMGEQAAHIEAMEAARDLIELGRIETVGGMAEMYAKWLKGAIKNEAWFQAAEYKHILRGYRAALQLLKAVEHKEEMEVSDE